MNKSDYNTIKKKFKHKNLKLYYIHTDQLNIPRAITNSNQSTVWKWDNTDPFGNNQPTNLGIDFNLRFPGQYADNESGLFYNYYRYYNPETGRYNQVDPIGLSGGYDVYGYVNQNPIKFSDKLGLDTIRRIIRSGGYLDWGHSAIEIDGTVFSLEPDKDKAKEREDLKFIGLLYIKGELDVKDFDSFMKAQEILKNNNNANIDIYEINVTTKEKNNLKTYLNGIASKNNITYGGLGIYYNNCATFIDNSLNLNLTNYTIPTFTPKLQQLKMEINKWSEKW